jgi:hypothetical protein
MEQLSVDIAARIQWSHWSNCESSFNLVLVPHHPGVYALAEEVAEPESVAGEIAASAEGTMKRRKLAIFSVNETSNLAYAVSSLFAVGNPVGEHMSHSRCYVRYAVIEDAAQRHEVYNALETWLALSMQRAKEGGSRYAVPSTQKWPLKMEDVSGSNPAQRDCGAKR